MEKNLSSKNKQILIIGPYPPTLGGVTVECLTLTKMLRAFSEQIGVGEFNTNRTTLSILGSVPRLLIQIFQSDAIFVYGSHRRVCDFSILFVPLCKLLRKRVVVKITGGNLYEFYKSKNSLYRNALGYTLFNAHAVFLETKYLVEKFSSKFSNVNWFPMTRIGDDVAFDELAQKQVDLANHAAQQSTLKVVFLGYVCVPKGILLLLDAADALEGVTVDVFGEFRPNGGPELSQSTFEGRSARYKGVVSPSELPAVLSNYDVLVLPTHYPGEGYPGVLIEAKRAGLAVVSTRWRSIPEIVNHDKDGLLIEPHDLDQLINTLQRLGDDRELLSRIRKSSHASFANFDTRKWGEVLMNELVNR